ncbi:TPA: hypothetical protein O7I44_001896 [Staphylococcus aureus]|uniref:Uncharacterized protein n=1 Tax=Staphylococcus aureus TaxID=1280 RepID=A0A6B5HU14_STAAU|nr:MULTISPECIES: hypothetical protein [Staphylococcus]MUK57651.1 hypothetical protein [Pseudomonas aeruginosa]AJP65151.1 hypothetical protein UG86_03550 [Staphylococcus aureus]ALO30781.1 hypothetical protein ASU36_00780 [Staphylococcus aureus]AUU50298.1 hypothetical protein RK79_005745 [Staphylococcus aureus]ELF7057838.1 hypothetical protein [Staphylococcus aureus]
MLQLFLMKLTLNDFENDKTILIIILKNHCYEEVCVLSN